MCYILDIASCLTIFTFSSLLTVKHCIGNIRVIYYISYGLYNTSAYSRDILDVMQSNCWFYPVLVSAISRNLLRRPVYITYTIWTRSLKFEDIGKFLK